MTKNPSPSTAKILFGDDIIKGAPRGARETAAAIKAVRPVIGKIESLAKPPNQSVAAAWLIHKGRQLSLDMNIYDEEQEPLEQVIQVEIDRETWIQINAEAKRERSTLEVRALTLIRIALAHFTAIQTPLSLDLSETPDEKN